MTKHWLMFGFALLLVFALPALAQQDAPVTNDVSFNGIAFSYDTALGVNVNIVTYPGDTTGTEQPGGPQPPSLTFHLYDAIEDSDGTSGRSTSVSIYETADLAAYTFYQEQVTALQTLIATQPDLTTYAAATAASDAIVTLPFLPVSAASQVIRANASYFNTALLSGVSYITAYRQDASPFTADEFVYTIQAISRDGAYYVSAVRRVNVSAFPAQPDAVDMDEFMATFDDYLTESVAQIEAADTQITPAPILLDALLNSLTIGMPGMTPDLPPAPTDPVPTPTAIANTDPTLGGLAGTWTLVSYGDPAAPIPALTVEENMMGRAAQVSFTADGIGGSSGCNTFGGSFTYNNGAITISQLFSTMMACVGVMEQEAALLAALSAATTYTIVEDTLTINYTDADGAPGVLTFTRDAAV